VPLLGVGAVLSRAISEELARFVETGKLKLALLFAPSIVTLLVPIVNIPDE
jgi:hypothetical protein